MLAHRAAASFTVHRTNAVTELSDFCRSPIEFGQPADDACDDRSFADVPRVSAHHHQFHNNHQRIPYSSAAIANWTAGRPSQAGFCEYAPLTRFRATLTPTRSN